MTETRPDSSAKQEPRGSVTDGLLGFTVRAIVVAVVLVGGLAALMPDLRAVADSIKREVRQEHTRLRLMGLLTTNPQVHMRVSYIKENSGDIKGAIDEIDLAIGLLELHSSDKAAKDRYRQRLEELKAKMPAPKQ